jgi:site-specific DNA-cytosine methylase
VERYETARKVSSHRLTLLMRRYPNYCRGWLFEDINELCNQTFVLLGAQGLVRVGPIDLVIVKWPCQGHTRAGRGEGLRDP